jgi:hypothetical protein
MVAAISSASQSGSGKASGFSVAIQGVPAWLAPRLLAAAKPRLTPGLITRTRPLDMTGRFSSAAIEPSDDPLSTMKISRGGRVWTPSVSIHRRSRELPL